MRAFTELQTEGGGPVMWVNWKYRCPDCTKKDYKDTACCTEAPEGYTCRPDADTFEEDNDVMKKTAYFF